MTDIPTSLQYRLGVEIGRAVVAAMRDGMSYPEVLSTLLHSVQVAEMNQHLGVDFTKEEQDHDQS
ncbi:MAG: hypothetical protein Q4G49_03180 [Paracoccus sp. (in: a-proteobacteria)]|nr:hypothetical protein [Paracoccus sp. (in: a-proteobacteria)]